MPLELRIDTVLDEKSADEAADKAVKTFADAGERAGDAFNTGVDRRFKPIAGRDDPRFQAFINGGADAGKEAGDKLGTNLVSGMETHGQRAASNLLSGLTSGITAGMPGVSSALSSGISSAAAEMGAGVSAGALVAVGALAGIAAGAVAAGVALYGVGQRFDAITNSLAVRTGKIGDDLDALTTSLNNVASNTASSFEDIADVLGRVSQSLHLAGDPLETVTKQIADLNRLTGETLNIRDLGQAMRAFGQDGAQASTDLNELEAASQATGVPLNELLSSMVSAGPAARTLGLDFNQLAGLLVKFDEAGINAAGTQEALSTASQRFSAANIDLKTGLADTITQIQGFLAAGNDAAAVDLAGKVFGTRGAQQFVDAIRQGKVTVDDLNTGLSNTGDTIQTLNAQTSDWAETWQQTKNKVSELANTIGGPLFDAVQLYMGALFNYPTGPWPSAAQTYPGAPAPIPVTPDILLGTPPPGVDVVRQPQSPQSPLDALFGPGGSAPQGQSVNPFIIPPGVAGPPTTPGAPPQDIAGALADQGRGGSRTGPQIPYPAEYGQGPLPGETAEQWQQRMRGIELQHTVDEKRAAVDALEKDNTTKEADLIKARNELQAAQQNQIQGQQQAGRQQATAAAEVPYGPGYGAAPRPGETSQQYSAEQRVLESEHARAQAAARLEQLQADAAASPQDLTKARNDLAKAERDEYNAQLQLQEAAKKTTGTLGDLGAQIDADFGISKGIPGIIENLVKTIANVAAAPMLGQMAAVSAANEQATGIKGGYGALGIWGAQNIAAGGSPLGLSTPPGTTGVQQARTGAYTPAYSPAGTTGASSPAGIYPGDAALLAHVPAGTYNASGDLAQGLGDCSSAVEDLVNIMDGRSTAGRGMSTGNAPEWLTQHGFLPGSMPGAFNVGFNSGHMQATLPGGTPFNWGSDAAAARGGVGGTGAYDPSFTSHYYRPASSGWTPAPSTVPIPAPAAPIPGPAGDTGHNIYKDWYPPSGPNAAPGPTQTPAGGVVPAPGQGVQGTTGLDFYGGPTGPPPGPTQIGGLAPPASSGGGGGGIGITPGGSVDTALGLAASAVPGLGQAAQTGMKLANRAIQYAGQVAAIGVGGLIETFLPAGASEMANKSWLTRIASGIASARPALPNTAGQSQPQMSKQGQQGQDQQGNTQNNQINVTNNGATEDQNGNAIAHHLAVQNGL